MIYTIEECLHRVDVFGDSSELANALDDAAEDSRAEGLTSKAVINPYWRTECSQHIACQYDLIRSMAHHLRKVGEINEGNE